MPIGGLSHGNDVIPIDIVPRVHIHQTNAQPDVLVNGMRIEQTKIMRIYLCLAIAEGKGKGV